MSDEILASYTFNEALCLRADRALFHLQLRRPVRWAMNAVSCLMVSLGLASFWAEGERGAILAARGMLVFGIFWLSLPWLRRWRLRRQVRRSPEAGMEITWAFSEDGIRSSSPLVSSTSVWSLIAGVEEIPSGFLLIFTNRRRIYLPKEAFQPDDLEPFVALVARMTAKKAKMDLGGELL